MEADGRAPIAGSLRRLIADLVTAGAAYPLVLTGGLALRALGLVDRPVRNATLATDSQEPLPDLVVALRAALAERGWRVGHTEADPLSARFAVTDPETGEERAVLLLKETVWRPLVTTGLGPCLAAEDVVGTKVRALAARGFARDFIDVHAASAHWPPAELEEFGRRHAWDDAFDPADLRARLDGADWIDDREFAAYGLADDRIAELRAWARVWSDDIGERLLEEAPYEDEEQDEGQDGT
ncbi:nucleotidyl transferase AbiEii/AbiGii toxin family protein [Streptomyces sp. L500]|uniref:nucleotidyl transferase AbiEii/AbiGii toxin family protein n=1 Tax=Streptomyces abikoensis TaxID=97398 RepID=UPI0036C51F28